MITAFKIIKTLKKTHKEYQKLSFILVTINGKGQNFQQGQKTGKSYETIALNILFVPYNAKTIKVAY